MPTPIPLPFPPPENGLNPAAALALVVPGVLIGLDRLGRFARPARARFLTACLGVVAIMGAYAAWLVASRLHRPPESDFMAFWIPARTAAHGLNFYDPASYRDAMGSFSPDFRAEILRVGFWYPPPSMFLVLPLGFLAVPQAVLLWYLVLLGAMAACVRLLWREFLPGTGSAGLAACLALILLLRSTYSTLGFAQTNFLELASLVGFWRTRHRAVGGVWLALAAVIKPFALLLLAFPALRRGWAVLVAAIATLVGLTGAACLAFGAHVCASYLVSGPVTRLPDYVYSQDVTQSLWATLLKLAESEANPLTGPERGVMLAAAAVVLAIATWAAFRLRSDERLLFALVLTTGLILYPLSLEHYSVVLLLPLLMAWARPDAIPGGRLTLITITGVVFLLIGFGYGGVFWAYAVLWTALLAAALWRRAPRAEASA